MRPEESLIHVPGLLSRWVRLGSGAKAHYVTSGETGPSILLLHGGLPGSSGAAGWRYMAPFLGANGFRVYCPDQPGFGLSDTRREYWPRDPSSHVDFLHEFTTALCLDRFHLAGNSMGCLNTVNYVCAHPERVESFALIAGLPGDLVPVPSGKQIAVPAWDGSEEAMKKMMEAIIYRTDAITPELIRMRTEAANLQRDSHAQYWASMNGYRNVEGGGMNHNLMARLTTKGRIDRITIPAIYLWGKNDVIMPVDWAYAQEDALPNIQFFYPDECGHQGQTDQPELFNQVFLEFFRDGRVSPETADRAGVSRRRAVSADLVGTDH